jgi:hypothetical protein
MTLFNSHLKILNNLEQSRATLFVKIFLNDRELIHQQLGLILQSIDGQTLGMAGIGAALAKLLDLGLNLE